MAGSQAARASRASTRGPARARAGLGATESSTWPSSAGEAGGPGAQALGGRRRRRLECPAPPPALHGALAAPGLGGRVVAAGFYQGGAARSASARSSTTTGSNWWRPRSPAPPPHPAWPAGGPVPASPTPSWTWWPRAASTRCRWSSHVVDASAVADALALLDRGADDVLQVVLRFLTMAVPLACQEQLLPGRTLQEKFAFATEAGFDGIELRGKGDFHFADRLPELKPGPRRRGGHADGVRGDAALHRRLRPRPRRDAIQQLRSQLVGDRRARRRRRDDPGLLGQFSRRLPPFEPPRGAGGGPGGARSTPSACSASTPRARASLLVLEPLNRYEDHMVNTLDRGGGALRRRWPAVVGSSPTPTT